MHHVRKIKDKDLRKSTHPNFFIAQMAGINSKQVPLCKNHHVGLHRGSLCERDRNRDRDRDRDRDSEFLALGSKSLVRKQK